MIIIHLELYMIKYDNINNYYEFQRESIFLLYLNYQNNNLLLIVIIYKYNIVYL